MSYSRLFISMVCEAKGYEYKGKPPAGRCIIEARNGAGKLSVWAQDLKPETLYACFLLFPDGTRYAGVSMGSLPVDVRGKAETRYECDADNINGSGFSLSACVAVAVMAVRAAEPTATLCGYRDAVISWKRAFYEVGKKAALTALPPVVASPPVETAPAEAPLAAEAEEAVVVDLDVSVTAVPETPYNDVETPMASVNETTPDDAAATDLPADMDVETQAVFAPNKTEETASSPETIASDSLTEMAHQFHMALERLHGETNAACELTETVEQALTVLFEENIPMHPFRKQNRSVKWVRVAPKDKVPLPLDATGLYDDPFILAAYRQYNHLVLGVTTDTGRRQYILGVPGMYAPEQRPQAVRLGFSQFKCCDDTRVARGEYGYWLMFMNG